MSLCIHEIPLDRACPDCPGDRVLSLAAAARALLEHVEEVTKGCYRDWNGTEYVWNDEIWERADPDEFKLVKALREALQYEWIRA
jgi:hypothetical protein